MRVKEELQAQLRHIRVSRFDMQYDVEILAATLPSPGDEQAHDHAVSCAGN